jgi:polar amino acid transport system substrate-binding protein
MRKLVWALGLVCFLGLSGVAVAGEVIRFAFNSQLSQPIVIDAERGIEVEIVRTAFDRVGLEVEPVFMVYKRMDHSLGKTVDARGITNEKEDGFYYSDIYLSVQNYAYTKADNSINLSRVYDVFGLSVGAWQTAPENLGGEMLIHYGKDYANYHQLNLVTSATDYARVKMLISGRIEVNIEEENIFRYLVSRAEQELGIKFKFNEHNLWREKTEFNVAFIKKEHRDLFDKGLASIRADGTYDEIIQKYRVYREDKDTYTR